MMHIINLLGIWKQTVEQLTSRQIFLVRTPFMETRHLTLTTNMDKRHLTLTANRVLFFCLCVFLKLYFLLLWVKKNCWPNPLPYYYRYSIFIKRIIRWSMWSPFMHKQFDNFKKKIISNIKWIAWSFLLGFYNYNVGRESVLSPCHSLYKNFTAACIIYGICIWLKQTYTLNTLFPMCPSTLPSSSLPLLISPLFLLNRSLSYAHALFYAFM